MIFCSLLHFFCLTDDKFKQAVLLKKKLEDAMRIKNTIFVILVMVVVAAVMVTGNIKANKAKNNVDSNNGRKLDSDEIVVALVPNAGYDIKSTNPVVVKKGSDVSFDISFNDGYCYKQTDGFSYDNDKLTVKNVTEEGNIYYKPSKYCTIELADSVGGSASITSENVLLDGSKASIKMTPDEHYSVESINVNDRQYPAPATDEFTFVVEDDSVVTVNYAGEAVNFLSIFNNLGTVTILNDDPNFRYGDEVKLSCEYDSSEIVFNGFSKNGYLDNGGELITDATDYSFEITQDTIVYANFKDKHTYSISIDANGGVTNDSIDMSDCSPFVNINLPVDEGKLVRDGYTLTGYNTSADYSGVHYSLGALYTMPRNDVTLYAQWEQCTDSSLLTYTNYGAGISITGVSGDVGDTLCIPKTIGGVSVTDIGANAFSGVNSIKTAIIPIGVTSIGSGAFANCENLELVYIPETLTSMANDAYSNTPNFTHVNVLASLGMAFDYDYDSSLADKHMRLKNTQGKRIILVAGSSMTFGINSNLIKEKYPDYTVVNFSCSFMYGIIPLFDMLEANVHEGDIVIFAPEYYEMMYATSQSPYKANWQYVESNYDILNDINVKNSSNMLTTYIDYLTSKKGYLPGKLKNSKPAYVRSGMNQEGDLVINRTNQGSFGPELPNASLVTDTGMGRYNDACKALSDNGATCLFSFPPMANGGTSEDYLDNATSDFLDALKEKLDSSYCTLISTVGEYGMDSSYFYDNCYHLTNEGAVERTKILLKDLEKWGGIK